MEVEVEEIIEEILEQRGLLEAEINSIHYYTEHDVSEEELEERVEAKGPLQYSQFLQVPQEPTKRKKVSFEHIIDYTQFQIVAANEHIEALESIHKKKIIVA